MDEARAKTSIEERNRLEKEERKIDKMFTYVKGFLQGADLKESINALTYMRKRHAGQKRESGESYIVHPLRMASTAMALGIRDDDLLATILIHDVIEDTGVTENDLPFNDRIRRSVKHMTVTKFGNERKSDTKKRYYKNLLEDPNAIICKGLDRGDNLSTIIEMPEKSIVKNVLETNIMLMPVMREAKELWPNLSNILYVLRLFIRNINTILAFGYRVDPNDEELLMKILDDPDFVWQSRVCGSEKNLGSEENIPTKDKTKEQTKEAIELARESIPDFLT